MKATTFHPLVAGTLLALQSATGTAGAAPPQPSAPTINGLKPLAENAWDYGKAHHLLSRAGFGGSPEEVARLHALGLRGAVDFLLTYQTQPDLKLPAPIELAPRETPQELAKLSPQQRQQLAQQRRREEQQQMRAVRTWWIRRLLESPRPLEEKLVVFWHGHFATEYRTVRDSRALYQQNQLFREHAAGNFGKLLHAIVHDPAMLRYLDNNRNVKGNPNENLAREILELFAMGVDQGYTEQDIKEGARALTGHTYNARTGKYRFVAANHDPGAKTIFGQTGNWNADQFVDLILKQPATARFLARKLFSYFAHEHPDEAILDQLAQILRDHDYELSPLLKTLFLSEEFYSQRTLGTQIKSPVQLVIGTLRTLRIQDADPEALATVLRAMGQDLFEPPNVKGWEGGHAWINANLLFARANFPTLVVGRIAEAGKVDPKARRAGRGEGVAGLRVPGKPLDAVRFLRGQELETPTAVVDAFARALLAVPLTEAERQELIAFLGPLLPSSQWVGHESEVNAKLGALVVLMMSMPEYQLT